MQSRTLALALIQGAFTITQLADFLRAHGHEDVLRSVLREAHLIQSQNIAHETFVVRSPFNLGPDALTTLRTAWSVPETAVTQEVLDQSLLAGYVFTYKGVQVDASSKRIIQQFLRA